jgi:hypothetical protein
LACACDMDSAALGCVVGTGRARHHSHRVPPPHTHHTMQAPTHSLTPAGRAPAASPPSAGTPCPS